MYKILRFVYFLFVFCNIYATIPLSCDFEAYNPILLPVIMIKNEETVIRATLQPFLDAGIKSFYILDTGSTDRTIEVTKELFAEYSLDYAYIHQEPFIDFATSRNHALEYAEKCFPDAAFMVMLDAEWYLHNVQGLVDFCTLCLTRGDIYPSYLIHIINDCLDNYTCRLIRAHTGTRFGGAVHETIIQQTNMKVPESVFFEYLPKQLGHEKTLARFARDREVLYQEYRKNPRDTRTLFYLARTCEDLGNLEEAYNLYKERVKLVGWDEEDFIVHYRLAETIKFLVLQNYPERYRWHEALEYYLKAYQMRPHRAEPLIGIAEYYVLVGQFDLAYLFAKRAIEVPYPVGDTLFIHKYWYIYYRYELLARCAWYVNEFEIGSYAADMAYAAYPDYEYARINKSCYDVRKKEAGLH